MANFQIPLKANMFTHSGLSAFNQANIADGNITTNAWHTDSAAAGAYLQIDLMASKKVSQIEIYSAGAYKGIYDIWGSNNAAAWTVIVTGFAPSQTGWNVREFNPKTFKYWRLRLANTPGTSGWINELVMREQPYDLPIPAHHIIGSMLLKN